jgi:hypothetical protein
LSTEGTVKCTSVATQALHADSHDTALLDSYTTAKKKAIRRAHQRQRKFVGDEQRHQDDVRIKYKTPSPANEA